MINRQRPTTTIGKVDGVESQTSPAGLAGDRLALFSESLGVVATASMPGKLVFLMRGLPACGKSHLAQRLAGDAGVVLETDQFFVRPNSAGEMIFDYREDQLAAARQWVFERFQRAIVEGRSPIVLDRGNGLNEATRLFVQYAVEHGYQVELKEPDSDWWLEIRQLMRDRPRTNPQLAEWAVRLAEMSRANHRVPLSTIQSWMNSWYLDLTVEDILKYGRAVETR